MSVLGTWLLNETLNTNYPPEYSQGFIAEVKATMKGSKTVTVDDVSIGLSWDFNINAISSNASIPLGLSISEGSLTIEGEGTMDYSNQIIEFYKDGAYQDVFAFITKEITIAETDGNSTFEYWLPLNAERVVTDKPLAEITYNGQTIAQLNAGETATLSCKEMVMVSDVVVKVNEVESSGECNHETYLIADDLASISYHDWYATLKPKIAKPSIEKSIELITDSNDAEQVFEYMYCDYAYKAPVIDGVTYTALQIKLQSGISANDPVYSLSYAWEEDIEDLKVVASLSGIADTSFITGEGWYNLSALSKLTDDDLARIRFSTAFDFFRIQDSYFYSIFDFHIWRNSEYAIADMGIGEKVLTLATADKYCENNLIVINDPRIKSSVVTEITSAMGTKYPHTERELENELSNWRYCEVEMIADVTDASDHSLVITRHSARETSNNESYVMNDGNVTTTDNKWSRVYSGNTYGLTITADLVTKIMGIYTNATIVSQDENTAYISGLRHNTYIVVKVGAIEQ